MFARVCDIIFVINYNGDIMFELFIPDKIFENFYDITPGCLLDFGIKAVISDIDNTLAPYEIAEPTETIISWVRSLEEAGIKIAFLSNNHAERVELFNRTIGVPAYPDAGKPGKKSILFAMSELGVTPEETLMLGDQIFTDVLTGKRVGTRAFLVPPIKDKKTLFFKAKRLLEKPFLKMYYRRAEK